MGNKVPQAESTNKTYSSTSPQIGVILKDIFNKRKDVMTSETMSCLLKQTNVRIYDVDETKKTIDDNNISNLIYAHVGEHSIVEKTNVKDATNSFKFDICIEEDLLGFNLPDCLFTFGTKPTFGVKILLDQDCSGSAYFPFLNHQSITISLLSPRPGFLQES